MNHQGLLEGKKPGRGKRDASKLELESNKSVSSSVIAWNITYTMAATYSYVSISSYMR